MTHPHRWLRAAHKIAPNGAFSRYIVLSAGLHGTVKTVPYKPAGNALSSQNFAAAAKLPGGVGSPRPTGQYIKVSRGRGGACPARDLAATQNSRVSHPKGFPHWGKLSPQVTDEGATSGHFPLIRRVPRHLPPRGEGFSPCPRTFPNKSYRFA